MGRVIERLRGTPGLVLVAVLGLALGVGVGALIWSGSSDSGGSATTGTSADKRPIALPATLAGFRDVTDAMAARHPKAATLARQRANQTKVRAQTVAAYSAAFGGGAAAYRQYADSGLQRLPYVIAVPRVS